MFAAGIVVVIFRLKEISHLSPVHDYFLYSSVIAIWFQAEHDSIETCNRDIVLGYHYFRHKRPERYSPSRARLRSARRIRTCLVSPPLNPEESSGLARQAWLARRADPCHGSEA